MCQISVKIQPRSLKTRFLAALKGRIVKQCSVVWDMALHGTCPDSSGFVRARMFLGKNRLWGDASVALKVNGAGVSVWRESLLGTGILYFWFGLEEGPMS